MRVTIALCQAFALLAVSAAQQTAPNPILVPAYPAPTNLAQSPPIQKALQSIKAALEAAKTAPTVYGTLDTNTTSFSAEIYSIHDPQPLFTYHLSAPGLQPASIGVNTVNSDTIYRIGSVSKMLTVYTYLIAAGDASWNDPITKYVPEFAAYAAANTTNAEQQPFNYWDFDSITVGAIASQLGGIPRGYAVTAKLDALLTAAGLPPVPPVDFADCGGSKFGFTGVPCTRADGMANLFNQQPAFPPFYTPAYSNSAYTLLMYVLENITATNFPDLMQSALIEPLGLTSTTYSTPNSTANALIPFNETLDWWGYDLLDVNPAGGYYSTTNDMRKIGTAILNSTLLSWSQTRRWMKPHSFTYDPDVAVGAPWEIFKAEPLNRTSWMYTKSGDIDLYGTLIVYLPDWDVGITVLAGGLNFDEEPLIIGNIIAQYLLPALDEAAAEQAAANLVGTYVEPNSKSVITLAVDEYPGLNITYWTVGNESAFEPFYELGFFAPGTTGRIYPAGMVSGNGTQQAWKAVYETLPDENCSPGIFSKLICGTWTSLDFYDYGGVAVDSFLITTDKSGKATAVSPRDLRWNYQRQ